MVDVGIPGGALTCASFAADILVDSPHIARKISFRKEVTYEWNVSQHPQGSNGCSLATVELKTLIGFSTHTSTVTKLGPSWSVAK
jgi:alpha-tubulin suppressor-like RCC1 family protein